ncbi:glycosyltransferase [Myroides indicus]|uniref:Glycosyl transferase family 2 n=1 Tax=Myroides indicus TaxID=1323422 RepID=A0A4R7F5Y7_9FLAO|nr:glycosyltransferase [Myroides indicus]TDS64167.1 glycosyl transferase family 2 [Myroides indicus]
MFYSFIIPVYNRPDEIDELLQSLVLQTYEKEFEIVIVEDGSLIDSRNIVKKYDDRLTISYFYKSNSGPGDSRNYGMKKARGNYFIILDSDCILPPQYLSTVDYYLAEDFVHCFGGPDKALESFSNIQKAINFSMTSFLTTGGIRGSSERIGKFQPRSFNMGISAEAFIRSGGFGKIHPGEDPDLTIRLWNLGFETELFPNAFVYHKRRIDWGKFYRQVRKFGKARPILNQRYPAYSKITYWFPLIFTAGLLVSTLFIFFGNLYFITGYFIYFFIIFVLAIKQEKSLLIGFLSIIAVLVQFFGYGIGFAKSNFVLNVLQKTPEEGMPEMFFK